MIQERFENITLAYQRSIGPYGQHNRHFMENFKQTLDLSLIHIWAGQVVNGVCGGASHRGRLLQGGGRAVQIDHSSTS